MKLFCSMAGFGALVLSGAALGCDDSSDDAAAANPAAPSAKPATGTAPGTGSAAAPAPSGGTPDGPAPTSMAIVDPVAPAPSGSAAVAPPAPSAGQPAPLASAPAVIEPPPATPPPLAPAPPPPPPVNLPEPKAGSADAVAADVDAIYVPQKNFEASFDQSQRLKVQGKTIESKGRVFVQKPDKVAFKYHNGNIIVSDGTTLKTYVKADEQMVIQNLKGTQAKGAVSFLMGNGLRPSFTVEFHTKPWEPGWVLRGKPRQATSHYEHVFFFIDRTFTGRKSAEAMKTVMLIDAQGNRNRFDFTRAAFPETLRPEVFTFTPPPGTNIVRQ